jgi:pantetheine-phosphate adenylyltransferase
MSKIALFPGSFDPFTSGHLNILTRALTIFDEVVVAVGINQAKRGFYTMEQREDIISQATRGLKGVKIISYDGLTVELCKELGIKHIVRGVRNMTDFDNEQAVADANRHLDPDIDTIIIPTAQEYSHISSSAVRDLLSHHGDLSQFIPAWVVLPTVK